MNMKRLKIYALLFIPLMSYGQQGNRVPEQASFTLKGKLSDSPAKMLYLIYQDGGIEQRDSAIVKDGSFVLKGSLHRPVYARLYSDKKDVNIRFWLERSMLQLVQNSDKKYIVTGGTIANEQKEMNECLAEFNHKEEQIKAEKGLDSAARNQAMTALRTAKLQAIEAFVRQHPSSPISTEQVANLAVTPEIDPEKVVALFELLSPEQQSAAQGEQIKSYVAEIIRKAKPQIAPDFTILNVHGETVKLSDYRGKYLLLDFWASWCAPCRKENPNVLKAYQHFHSSGLEILAVSLDTNKEAWLAAIKQDGLPWQHVSDLQGWKSALAKLYQVMGIPDNYLIGPDGQILERGLREETLHQKLAKHIKVK